MKTTKKVLSVLLSIMLIVACFAGCSSTSSEKYSDTVAILGYTSEVAPFITSVNDGTAEGFSADLWSAIFDSVKGDLKSYRFEQVEEGYTLEESGGFFDSSNKEYSACLLMGAVSKNNGTFNEDYSYTEPIITNRVIAVTQKDSTIKSYADFADAKVAVVSEPAKTAFSNNSTIAGACAEVFAVDDIDSALKLLRDGNVSAVVTDEFSFNPLGVSDEFTILDGELDTIEYVIACAKNSGWKDSINEAIKEMKSENYGDGDEFTPLVEKYFGYNASSFEYVTDTDK